MSEESQKTHISHGQNLARYNKAVAMPSSNSVSLVSRKGFPVLDVKKGKYKAGEKETLKVNETLGSGLGFFVVFIC